MLVMLLIISLIGLIVGYLLLYSPEVNLIVATGANGEIGRNGGLLDHFPADMRHFREKTLGSVVIMGRKTFDSLPEKNRPLPERINIVIARKPKLQADFYQVSSIKLALGLAKVLARLLRRKIFVIGGAQIYHQFLAKKLVDRIYLTRIHRTFFDADKFISINMLDWSIVDQQEIFADGVAMEFVVLQKPQSCRTPQKSSSAA